MSAYPAQPPDPEQRSPTSTDPHRSERPGTTKPPAGSDSPTIISFIATSDVTEFEAASYDLHELELPEGTVEPGFLSAVYATLLQTGAKAAGYPAPAPDPAVQHLVVRVASVTGIATWLKSYLGDDELCMGPKVRVQIIGHGVSGELSLGASWPFASSATPNGTTKDRYASPYYVLDSSPRPLYELHGFMGRIAEVVLAGCYVGQRLSDGNPVNGRALMFTLAEMWHCKVRGANAPVHAENFHRTGWYDGPVIGWAWNASLGVAERDEASDARPAVIADPLSTPQAISTRKNLLVNDARSCAQFAAYFDSRLLPAFQPRLAGVELSLDLHYASEAGSPNVVPASIVGNGKFLRVALDGGVVYYANAADARATGAASVPNFLQRLLRRLRAGEMGAQTSGSAA